MRDIEKLIQVKVPAVKDHPYLLKEGTKAPAQQTKKAGAARNSSTRAKKSQGSRGGQKTAQRPHAQTKKVNHAAGRQSR